MAVPTLIFDPSRARVFGEACARIAERARETAGEVSALLSWAGQPSQVQHWLAEVRDEVSALGRVVVATADVVEGADGWLLLKPTATGAMIRLMVANHDLWGSLNDSTGVTALEVGAFDFAASFRTMTVAEWRAAVYPPGCGSFGEGLYYTGGGGLVGADGELYSVVIPHFLTDDGRHYTIDGDLPGDTPTAASLGGADPGWIPVDYRFGVERIESDPGRAWKFAVGAAVASGLQAGSTVDPDQLVGIHLALGVRPHFSESPTPNGRDPIPPTGSAALTSPDPTAWVSIDGRPTQVSSSQVPDIAMTPQQRIALTAKRTTFARAQVALGVVGVATQAAQGVIAAQKLDDPNLRAFEVVFEQHPDGRRRARVQTFTLEQGPYGVSLYGWHLFLDDEGNLHESPTAYQVGPAMHGANTLLATNPYDPDFTTRLPNAAIGGE